MSFMQPQVVFGLWYAVDSDEGTDYIPSELVSLSLAKGEELSLDSLYEKHADLPAGWTNTEYETAETVAENEWGEITSALKDYVSGSKIDSVQLVEGWGARLSAPGYMDCTEWCVFGSESEAIAYLRDDLDVHEWEVIVDNVGTVYSGDNEDEAGQMYADYVQALKERPATIGWGMSRSVTLFCDSEIEEEFTLPDEGDDNTES